MVKAVDASSGGAFLVGAGVLGLAGATLRAGVDAATATIRETDGSGRILAVLGAAAGDADHWQPKRPVAYSTQVFVATTGTAPTLLLLEP